jgi:hypothetical protein
VRLIDQEDGSRLLVFLPKIIFESTMSFLKNVVFKDQVIHEGTVTFDNLVSVDSDTAGRAIIPKWTTTVTVPFDKPYTNEPVVTISQVVDDASESSKLSSGAVVANVTKHGFTISLKEPSPTDIVFNWIALGVSNKRIIRGEDIPGAQLIITPTPPLSPTPLLLLEPPIPTASGSMIVPPD